MTGALTKPAIRKITIDALHRSIGLLNGPVHVCLPGEPDRDLAFEGLELDSLTTLEVLMEIEDASGVEFDPELLPELGTLNHLVDYVVARQGGNG